MQFVFTIYSCLAPRGAESLRYVITGLALAAAADNREIALYFGCVAQTRGLGGAGLLRMPENQVTKANITALRLSGGDFLRAGAMFLVDRCRMSSAAAVGRDDDDVIDDDYDDDNDTANVVNRRDVPSGLLAVVTVVFFFVVVVIVC